MNTLGLGIIDSSLINKNQPEIDGEIEFTMIDDAYFPVRNKLTYKISCFSNSSELNALKELSIKLMNESQKIKEYIAKQKL